MTSAAPKPAYAAPAAQGAVAYYGDKAGKPFLQTRFAGHAKAIGETFETYRVEGFTDGVEGLTWRQMGQDAPRNVDGLPVAVYLPVVSKPSPAMLAAQGSRVAA